LRLVLYYWQHLSWLLDLFLCILRLHLEETLLLGLSSQDPSLLDLLLDRLLDALLSLAPLVLERRLLSSHAALGLAQCAVLYQPAVQQLVLLLTVLQKEVAHVDLVKVRVHVQSLKLSLFPLTLLLFGLLPAFLLPLFPLFLSLLHLLDLLLSLLLPLLLLFLPLTLLLLTLNHSLLDPLHPFDLLDLDELLLVGEQLGVELLSVLVLALSELGDLGAQRVSLRVDLVERLLDLFFVLLRLVLRLLQLVDALTELIDLYLKVTQGLRY
jgi:hypothetical protein